MGNFFSVLAQAIIDAAPVGEEQDEIVNRLWGAHAHHSIERGINMYRGLSEETQRWLRPVIQKTTEAYRQKHPREQIPDFESARDGGHIQTLAEATSDAIRRFRVPREGSNRDLFK